MLKELASYPSLNDKIVLITGGCGFIGHHFVEHICVNTDWNIIVLDKLTYASNLENKILVQTSWIETELKKILEY